MLKEMKNLVGFLTIIPVGVDEDSLADAAKYMPLFPLVGAIIGLLAGLLAWLLSQFFPDMILGMLTLGFLLLITGLHHTDGLLDFGDGVMCQGPPEKKIRAMHDQSTGAGGLALGFIILMTTAFCISALSRSIITRGLIVSEVLAKLSMVVGAWAGKSAHEGMNTFFVDAMHGKHRKLRLGVALTFSFSAGCYLLGRAGITVTMTCLAASLVMVKISKRHFGGVTGDVIGAMNEIIRMVSLLAILVVTSDASRNFLRFLTRRAT